MPDRLLTSFVLIGSVVLISNAKLLSDSNSITLEVIIAQLVSTFILIGGFYFVTQQP
jgi:hypothetical protein